MTSYISAIVGAEQRFRPHSAYVAVVGGDAIPADAPTRSLFRRRNSAYVAVVGGDASQRRNST